MDYFHKKSHTNSHYNSYSAKYANVINFCIKDTAYPARCGWGRGMSALDGRPAILCLQTHLAEHAMTLMHKLLMLGTYYPKLMTLGTYYHRKNRD